MWMRFLFIVSACYSSLLFSQEISSNRLNIQTKNNHVFDYSVFDKKITDSSTISSNMNDEVEDSFEVNNTTVSSPSIFDKTVTNYLSINNNNSINNNVIVNVSKVTNTSFDYPIFNQVILDSSEPQNVSDEYVAIDNKIITTSSIKTTSFDYSVFDKFYTKQTNQPKSHPLDQNSAKSAAESNKNLSTKKAAQNSSDIQDQSKELTATEKNALNAYSAGRLLRAQFKDELALEQLKYAADLGNIDAQFLYGITRLTYQPSDRTLPIAKDYLFRAGEQGHLRAMFEMITRDGLLTREQQLEWENDYLEKIQLVAKDRDSHGYFLLYEYYTYQNDSEQAKLFFKKALEKEHPQAMFIHAENILNGDGLFLSSQSRYEEANRWLNKATEKSYIPAYRLLIKNYEQIGDYTEAFYWRNQLLEIGDLLSLANLGKIFLGQSKAGYDQFIDKQQGLDYLALYLQTAGTDRMKGVYTNVEKIYNKEISQLTEEELTQHQESLKNHYSELRLFNFDMYLWMTLPTDQNLPF